MVVHFELIFFYNHVLTQVLMFCSRRGVEVSGNPRHGGVNPPFSNYDEIWTWIPIVRNSTEQCRSNVISGPRNVTTDSRGRLIVRNPRLPSYNEAVCNRGNAAIHSTPTMTSQWTPGMASSVLQTRNTNQNVQSNSNSSGNSVNTSHVLRVNRTGHNVDQIRQGATSQTQASPYERTTPAIQSTSTNAPRVAVTSASGSALQEARALVNQFSLHSLDSSRIEVNQYRHPTPSTLLTVAQYPSDESMAVSGNSGGHYSSLLRQTSHTMYPSGNQNSQQTGKYI